MSTYPLNELGNAQLFAACFGDKVRYDHKRKSWFQFQTDHGRRWAQDETNYVRHYAAQAADKRASLAVAVADEKAQKAQFKYASDSKNVRNIDATLKLAASLQGIAFDKTWDADPWLFQVENGVIDLRTGYLRDAQIEDYLLAHSKVKFDADAKCPKWEKFLSEIFQEKTDLIRFIQHAVGYSLTGSTKEQVLFCLYGGGSNGKGVFTRILSALFGEYGTPVSKEILFQTTSRIIGDGANLPGKRLVTANEVGGKGELDSDRIKSWTGSDEMVCRELYKPAYSFQPQFKLWLSFNSRPLVSDTSKGLWRRLRMIPFDASFEGMSINKALYEELSEELPGILNWAILGCKEWQASKVGLEVPDSIERVNRTYREEFNPLHDFIAECCQVQTGFSCPTNEFYARYVKWCKEQNERPLGKPRLNEQLKALGVSKDKPSSGPQRQWQYSGIELIPEMTANWNGERITA